MRTAAVQPVSRPSPTARHVLVSGGTGYIGTRLVAALIGRGHAVRVLTRPESVSRVPAGAEAVPGDALEAAAMRSAIRPGETVVHLVGTPHPSPAKAAEFTRVDLASIRATTTAVPRSGASHLVYVSVAHPAPVMRAYVAARAAGEALVATTGVPATVLRPWYVLGPGHRWPQLLVPLYAIAARVPRLRGGAARLGLVTVHQMVAALVEAIENPPAAGVRVVEVPHIRRAELTDPD